MADLVVDVALAEHVVLGRLDDLVGAVTQGP